ncbi:carboxylesterase family protein [Nonomuraea jabiensis]|uniref:carboxylesterase family protein n=1 Tax=Nonomuraea jabiensis TaxID=882448 RepID=UPI003D71F57B
MTAGFTLAAAQPQAASKPRPSVVQLDSGRIRGTDDGTVKTYSGIRFARPPVRVASWRGGGRHHQARPAVPPGGRGLPGSGTFGLADQLEALRWVRRNAAAFGGDPDNVTLIGQSAGGISTCALLTSPAARRLIDKAVMQSGTCTLNWPTGTYVPVPDMPPITPYPSLKTSRDLGLAAAKRLGCAAGEELECLRSKPVAELMKVNDSFGTALAHGTPLLPLDPAQALRTGRFLRVPVISGGTKSEGTGFAAGTAQAGIPVTAENYPALMQNAFGEQAGKVLKEYPLTGFSSPGQAWATTAVSTAAPSGAGSAADHR